MTLATAALADCLPLGGAIAVGLGAVPAIHQK
jgi:hypothetical protein